MTIDVSIRGETGKFNDAFDLWFTDTANGGAASITTELMIWTHAPGFPPAGEPVATWTSGGRTAQVYAEDDVNPGAGVEEVRR